MSSSTIHGVQSSTDPGVKPSAQTLRLDRAATLVAIARHCLDNNLAMPTNVGFNISDAGLSYVNLTFATAEDTLAWTKHLGGSGRGWSYQPEWRDSPIYTYSGYASDALGMDRVSLDGWTPTEHLTSVAQNEPDPQWVPTTPLGFGWSCTCGAGQTYDTSEERWGYTISESEAKRQATEHETAAAVTA